MTTHTMQTIDGMNWFYYRTRLCNEFPTLKSRAFWWFLFDNDREYIGHFKTKAEMLKYTERYNATVM